MSFDYNVEGGDDDGSWTGSTVYGGLFKDPQVVVDGKKYKILKEDIIEDDTGNKVGTIKSLSTMFKTNFEIGFQGETYTVTAGNGRGAILTDGKENTVNYKLNHGLSKSYTVAEEETKMFSKEILMFGFLVATRILSAASVG